MPRPTETSDLEALGPLVAPPWASKLLSYILVSASNLYLLLTT